MSHFTCLVIGDDVEGQLAPFQENTCSEEYMEFEDTEDEWLEKYENKTVNVVEVDGKYLFPWDEKFRVKGTFGTGFGTHKIPEGLKEQKVPFKKLYKTFEEFAKEWNGNSKRDSKTGRYGYWFNPNAKWDWYEIGGRWSGFFKLKPGCSGKNGDRSWTNTNKETPKDRVDQARKGDIDWDGMRAHKLEDLEKLWKEAEGMNDTERLLRFGIENGMTKDEYLAKGRLPSTFAVLKDGKWYEKGEMGWWACVSNEKKPGEWEAEFTKLLEELPDDTMLSVVDCHI